MVPQDAFNQMENVIKESGVPSTRGPTLETRIRIIEEAEEEEKDEKKKKKKEKNFLLDEGKKKGTGPIKTRLARKFPFIDLRKSPTNEFHYGFREAGGKHIRTY